MANSFLKREVSTGTNQKTWTVSVWIKMTNSASHTIFSSDVQDDGANYGSLSIEGDGLLKFINMQGGSLVTNYQSNRKLVDFTSWYHIVLRVDTTQSSAGDRIRLYVNGIQETSWAYSTNSASQNADTGVFKSGNATLVGTRSSAGGNYVDGNMAHMHIISGQSHPPSVFGQTDSTTGEWKPKLTPTGITYDSENSAFLKFENPSALGTDSSGQSNTFTVNGNLKQSLSTPSNMFNTLNRNESYQTGVTAAIKYAGTGWEDAYTGNDGPKGSVGTLAMTKGKWYYEMKYLGTSMYSQFGISKAGSLASSIFVNTHYRWPFYGGNTGDGFGFQVGNTAALIHPGDTSQQAWLTDANNANSGITMASNGQICMVAFDLDAGKIWWGINGTWNTVPNSTTTTSSSDIASGNNAHKTWTPDGEFYRSGHSEYNRFGNAAAQKLNFGEGRFGTDAVASGNADSAGEGVFEFAPPSGFLAICTKNIKNTG